MFLIGDMHGGHHSSFTKGRNGWSLVGDGDGDGDMECDTATERRDTLFLMVDDRLITIYAVFSFPRTISLPRRVP